MSIISGVIFGPSDRANLFDAATELGATDKYGATSASIWTPKSSPAATPETMPNSFASAAEKIRADINTRLACPSPMRAITYGEIVAGIKPKRVSVRPNFVP